MQQLCDSQFLDRDYFNGKHEKLSLSFASRHVNKDSKTRLIEKDRLAELYMMTVHI